MTSTYNLVLNGIAVTAGLHALQILLLVSLDPTRFQQINTWLIGSIFGNSWTHVDIRFSSCSSSRSFSWRAMRHSTSWPCARRTRWDWASG